MVDSLVGFLDRADAPERRLALLGDVPRPVGGLLRDLFGDESLTIEEGDAPSEGDGVVALVEADEVVATSGVDELLETILLVNSDLYVTGARGLEAVELPDVLAGLDGSRFRLRGYPASNKEKLLLITVSRLIERRAWEADAGTIRSSFQRLSRINDEQGTRRVYRRLGGSGVDVHVYGVRDEAPAVDATVHGGESREYRNSWFVVFRPYDQDADHAALLALEREPGVWDGLWSYDPDYVCDLEEYVATQL